MTKKNTDVITDDSQDTSDKSGNIIATGDNARIWIYILAGMSAIAVGIVSVKKKKEASYQWKTGEVYIRELSVYCFRW